ncbi:MAG: MarR family transcriptional regulator [Actinobacteria bacterium]|jgi:DNA-binding MarR family transcriptional regulator|nr:MarR family transcriptional regulator [Actinomycetota bacterium]
MVQATKDAAAAPAGPEGGEDQLFRALVVLIQRLRRMKGADHDGHAGRVGLLSHIDSLAPVRMSELASKACLDQSTVSRHLRQLEDDALVTRTPDPDDGRATLLELSPEGREVLDRHIRARSALISSATQSWSEEDRAALTRLLSRLADDLEPLS